MRALIFGAGGYVGSAVARNLASRGIEITGLARSEQAEQSLSAAGYQSVRGDYADLPGLAAIADRFDAIVFTPTIPFDVEEQTVRAILAPLEGSDRPFVFTSGTAVLSIEARDGTWRQDTFAEDDPFDPPEWIAVRVQTEAAVRDAASRGVRAMVVRPPLIWGNAGSKQIPAIFESVEKTGNACYLGRGLNLYSNVHVDDLAEIYGLALERGTAGALYHAVAGEANFRALAEAVADVAGCAARSVGMPEASEIWGERIAGLFFGVSSRSRALKTVSELGWAPEHLDVVDDIRRGSYARWWQNADRGA